MLAFARVVGLVSFTKALDSLDLSKTTVSSRIVALERRLGARLLNRTTRHISVTQEGAVYYDRVISLLSERDESEAMVTAAKVEPKGRLRVDMPAAVGHLIVIPALGSFVDRFPEISLEVECTDRPLDLISEAIDCVLRGNLIHDESLVARRLGTFDTATCASPGYLEKFGTPRTPAEMEDDLVCRLFFIQKPALLRIQFHQGWASHGR